MVEEQYYRQLLRWYPRSWRAHHGEVLLGIMLDEAEALGRSRPTVGQRWSVFLHGMGTRLGMQAALRCAVTGLILCLISFALFGIAVIMEGQGDDTIFSWAYSAMTPLSGAVVVPGYLGLVRERGVLPAPHAFVAAAVTVLTCIVATVSNIAWMITFKAVDTGAPVPLLGRLRMPLMVTYGVMGVLAVAVIVNGTLSIGTRMHAALRTSVAIMVGIPVAAMMAITALIPFWVFGPSLVLVILSLVLKRPRHQQPPTPSASPTTPTSHPSQYALHADIPKHPGSHVHSEKSRTPGGLPDTRAQDAFVHEAHPVSHRIGARLGRRTALACGILALVTYMGLTALTLTADLLPGRREDPPFFIQTALSCLIGFLLAIGVISLLRERAAATAQHTAYAAGILVLALISSATFAILGLVSAINAGSGTWSQWNDHVSVALFFVSWSLGAAAVGVLIDGLSACRRMDPGLRTAVGLLVGALTSPPLWSLLLFPGWGNLPGIIGLIVISAVSRPAPAPYPAVPSTTPRSGSRTVSMLSGRRITWIRLLAVSAVMLGVGAIASAVPNRAAGAAGMHLAFIPLLTALALWVSGRYPSSAVTTWGAAALAWASMAGFAVSAWWPSLREVLPVVEVSILCGGAALAWTVFTWLPARMVLRLTAGAGTGLIYMIATGLSLAFLKDYFLFAFVPMLTPAYGLIILRRPPTPAPPSPCPVPAPSAPPHDPAPAASAR